MARIARVVAEQYPRHITQRGNRRQDTFFCDTDYWYYTQLMADVMDEQCLLAPTRYIERNPVKAGLVSLPEDYPWSSAKAHIQGKDDDLVKVAPLLEMVDDWQQFLSADASDKHCALLQRHERTGRPLGDERFIAQSESTLSRILTPKKGGRPRKER